MSTGVPERLRDVRVFVLSPVRIYREGLAHVVGEEPGIRVAGSAPSLEEAVPLLGATLIDVVLLDVSMDRPYVALRRLTRQDGLRVVVFGVLDLEQEILACAEAGFAGYVTRDGTVAELVQTIRAAARGEFSCPPHIAGGLVRRLAVLATDSRQPAWQPRLTVRERQIVQLIDQGLSNKEIARLLTIQVATVKNHVHNILEKLGVRRRADVAATVRPRQAPDAGRELAGARARI
jgi:two-component system, NarL family, nitrate/nitrite response regulator NarL